MFLLSVDYEFGHLGYCGEKGKLDDGFVICVVAAKKRLSKGPREGYRTVPK